MSEEFTQGLLRHVVGKICQPLGWHAMNSNAADVLADVTRQYILTIGRTTSAYSCHDNRTEPNLVDLSQAFTDLGVSLPELAGFMSQVRSTPLEHKVPLYPVQQSSTHIHNGEQSGAHRKKVCRRGSMSSNQSSEESGDESIPPHLPPLPALQDNTTHKEEENDNDAESGVDAASEDHHSDTEPMETAPTLYTPHTPHDTSRGLPQPQLRSRIFSSDVSEDSGSRRSSVSEGALIRASDTRGGISNVFESAFKHELVKSESSKVELPQKTSVTKRPKLRRLSLNVENIMPSQQLSPLVSKIDSVPKRESPPPTSVPTQVTSPQEAQVTSLPQAQLYQVPQSPQRLPLKDFHVSTEKISVSLLRSSLSPPAHDTAERSEVATERSPKVTAKSSPEVVQNPTPPIESPPRIPEEAISSQPSPEVVNDEMEVLEEVKDEMEEVKDEVEVLEEVKDEMKVLEEAEITNRGKEEVVGLEEVLSRLSETESSEDEEVEKKEIEEEPTVEYRDSSIVSIVSTPSPVSRPLTPSPPSSRPLTPSPVSRPLTPSPPPPSRPLTPSSHRSSPVHAHSYPPPQDVELSEDNLSISDEGSNSDLDTKPPTEQADSEVEVQQEMLDYSSDTLTKGDTDFEEPVLKSHGILPKIEANEEIIEQITKVEPVSLPSVFEGAMSVEIGGSKDDSSEMINTLSAQVTDDYLETTKILELELSTDDDEDSGDGVPVFIGEESQDEDDPSTCVLTTSTERVKGETKGRKRTVSKEDVLGISKPKKVSRKRSKKSRTKTQKPPEPPVVSSLMVSIKKTLLSPPVKPLPLTPPIPPPPTTSVPLQITINRHLLRHTKFRLAPPTPEEKPKKSFEMLKIRLAKFGSLSTSTPKPQTDFEATPISAQTTPLGSRKRELEVSPSDETFVKRSRLEPQVVTTPLSSSSSSSSSDNEDSGSNPPTPTHATPSCPTPSPTHLIPSHTTPSRPTPTHLLPSHTALSLGPTRAPSSDDESSSSSSSSSDSVSGVSGVSGVGGGGGLKLTISKAVLQQAGRSLPGGGSVPRGGPSPWASGKPAAQRSRKLQATLAAKKRKQGSKKRSREAPPLLFSVPAVPRPPPTLPHPPPTITPSLGSDTICPVCNLKDDGSPMIGCDGCDDWCHWRCVGVVLAPPENEKWYCPGCREKAIKKKKKKLKKTKR